MTEHKPMLAPQKIPEITNLEYPVYVQPKYDGHRATYIPDVGFVSRSGKAFKNSNIYLYFSTIANCGDTVLDGELYIKGKGLAAATSVLSSESARTPPELRFMVFDAVPLEDWKKGSCELEYTSRLELLRQKVNNISDFAKIIDVGTDLAQTSAELTTFYKNHLTNGLEGAIVRSQSGLYKWGRVGLTGDLYKLKPFKSLDLKVVDIFSGKGKLANTIGGIICDYKGNEVRVGTGFSMEQRNEIYSRIDDFLGKTAEIKYLEETEKSLREPRFSRWRTDK